MEDFLSKDTEWNDDEWNDLGNGYEGKSWTNNRGNTGFITRLGGQSTDYPHGTEFRDDHGKVIDEHISYTRTDRTRDVEKNLAFFFQNDSDLVAGEKEDLDSRSTRIGSAPETLSQEAAELDELSQAEAPRDEIDLWGLTDTSTEAPVLDELDAWDDADASGDTRSVDELDFFGDAAGVDSNEDHDWSDGSDTARSS